MFATCICRIYAEGATLIFEQDDGAAKSHARDDKVFRTFISLQQLNLAPLSFSVDFPTPYSSHLSRSKSTNWLNRLNIKGLADESLSLNSRTQSQEIIGLEVRIECGLAVIYSSISISMTIP